MQKFGLYFVDWDFWAGKTKFTYMEAYAQKKLDPNTIIIANNDYDFVDLFFSSEKDLDIIFNVFLKWVYFTNDSVFLSWYMRPIIFIIDEATLYFNSRNFKNLSSDKIKVITQVRKRNMNIAFIAPRFHLVDKNIRSLSTYVQSYSRLWFFPISNTFEILSSEETDIHNPELENRSYRRIWHDYFLKWKTIPEIMLKKKYLTNYVIWADNTLNIESVEKLFFVDYFRLKKVHKGIKKHLDFYKNFENARKI